MNQRTVTLNPYFPESPDEFSSRVRDAVAELLESGAFTATVTMEEDSLGDAEISYLNEDGEMTVSHRGTVHYIACSDVIEIILPEPSAEPAYGIAMALNEEQASDSDYHAYVAGVRAVVASKLSKGPFDARLIVLDSTTELLVRITDMDAVALSVTDQSGLIGSVYLNTVRSFGA